MPSSSNDTATTAPRLAVAAGRLFVAFPQRHRLCQYDERGHLQRRFGSGIAGARDGPAASAQFNRPQGLAVHAHKLYVADSGNDAIRRVDLTSGEVTTIAGRSPPPDDRDYRCQSLRRPVAIVEYGDNFFIAAQGARRLLVLHSMGIGIAAGSGRALMADGEMLFAGFIRPQVLAVGQWGHSVYVLDAGHLRYLDYNLRSVRTAAPPADRPDPDWLALAADPQRIYLAHPEAPLVSTLDTYHHYQRLDTWALPLSSPISELARTGGLLWAVGADGHAVARRNLATGASHTIELE